MRRLPSSLLCLSSSSTLIVSILILSTLGFAAAPDRIQGTIDARQTVPLAKSLHPKAQPQFDLGLVDPLQPLSYITIFTSPSPAQQKALNQLLAQQQDKTSPNYHKWLTTQQYADRFGLSPNDLNKITLWLASNGLQVHSIGSGHSTIVFSGTVAQVQHAFGTEIHRYQVDGDDHFANATPVAIPAALNGIVTAVIGLHDFRALPANRGSRGGQKLRPQYYDSVFIFPNFLAPDDVATIYDISPLYNAATPINGANQTLAVVGQTDIYLDDINDFRTGFNLSSIPSSGTPTAGSCTVNANGIVISPCTTTNFAYVLLGTDPLVPSAGDLSESDLDLEWSGAVARDAQILFVNGETSGGVYDALTWVISPGGGTTPLATVVSMSYGYCEIGAPDLESLLQQGNSEGVTIVNSSGDVGSAACDYVPPGTTQTPPFSAAQYGLAVSYPASSPEVTGVGGTSISLANDSYPNPSSYWSTTLGPNGGTAVSYIPETAWNDDEELALYCHSPATGDTFCSTGGGTTGWVPLTTSATAAQVQSDIWISTGGGGASNCWYANNSGICLGAGAGPSGGGFAQPLYQQGLSIPSAPAGVRYVPDVSILASPDFPGYIFCTAQSELVSGGSSTSSCAGGIASAINSYVSLVGGTSVSAPVFAGIVTLLNQAVVLSGLQSSPGLGNINGNLYYLAAHTPTAFHQVNVGDNMVYCQPTLPTGFPSNVVCPAAGVFGYLASNKDTAEGTGYNLVTGLGSVDANNFVTAWADLVASSISILATPSTVIAGQTVTLTGTVTPATATGQVTFTTTVSGSTTTVGTASLSSGVATLSATNLPVGANSLNASYAGDSSDLPSSTTAAATVTVTAPTFNVSNPTTPSPAPAGTSTTSTFTVTPTGAATVSAITFACNGLPDATITCAFNPTQIPIGASSAVPVTLTITTSGPNPSGAVNNGRRRADNRSPWLPLTLPLAGIVIFGFAGRKLSRCSVILGLSFSLVLLGLLVACGGGSSAPAVGISVSPTAATVFANGPSGSTWPPQTASFTATVTNSTNMGVTWSISPTAAGSISSGGVYTAPTVAEGLPKTATVTATSQADSTKTASATVTITPTSVPGPYSITVTATEGPTQNTTAPFTLTVQ